jgi:hypothetical protein
MMAQQKKAMQHLLTYIPPRAGAAAADSVLSISLLKRENKPQKKSQYNLLYHSNFIIIIFFARNKDCEKNKKKKQRNQSQNKQTFLIRFPKKNTDRCITRFQHDWRSIPLASRLKFFTNSYPARVCV